MNWLFIALSLLIVATVVWMVNCVVLARLAQRGHNQGGSIIRVGARKARKAERERVTEVKRIAKQMEIGTSIYQMLHTAWVSTGSPTDLEVSLIPQPWNKRYSYRIGVKRVGAPPPKDCLAWIVVDLSRPKNEQIFICGEISTMLGFKGARFSVANGGQWIKSQLIPRIFPPQSSK